MLMHSFTYVETLRNLLLSRWCHYSVGGAWWRLGFYESF
jgi:hypothetical protein